MLQSRLSESLKVLGYDVIIGDNGEDAGIAIKGGPQALIVDLQSSEDSLGLIAEAVEARVPVLAYGQHTKANVLRQAREAGATVAVPRSELVEDLPKLLAKLSR